MFLSDLFLLSLNITAYFLVFTLYLNVALFAVILGVAFLIVTFTDPVEALILSDPPYEIFAV